MFETRTQKPAGRKRITVVGSINMDLVFRSARMPGPGETLIGTSFETAPGGKGANQAVAAARLGGRVEMIGCLGDDVFGDRLLEGLQRDEVGVAHIHRLREKASGAALIQVDAGGENAITVVPAANGLLDSARVEAAEQAIQSADAVLIQLEIPYDAVAAALRIARAAGVRVVLDPAPAPPDGLPEALRRVDILSPNQTEAALLTGIDVRDLDSARRAAAILQARGALQVVMKMAGQGALALDERGEAHHVPAFPASVVDTTAAGDAFTAALALGLAEGMPLVEAVRFGCAAGSLAVSRPGAQAAMPRREEVEGM